MNDNCIELFSIYARKYIPSLLSFCLDKIAKEACLSTWTLYLLDLRHAKSELPASEAFCFQRRVEVCTQSQPRSPVQPAAGGRSFFHDGESSPHLHTSRAR